MSSLDGRLGDLGAKLSKGLELVQSDKKTALLSNRGKYWNAIYIPQFKKHVRIRSHTPIKISNLRYKETPESVFESVCSFRPAVCLSLSSFCRVAGLT